MLIGRCRFISATSIFLYLELVMATLLYLYKSKNREIEKNLDKLPNNFFVMKEEVNAKKANAMQIASVPAILIFDNEGKVKVKREGSALVLDYIRSFTYD